MLSDSVTWWCILGLMCASHASVVESDRFTSLALQRCTRILSSIHNLFVDTRILIPARHNLATAWTLLCLSVPICTVVADATFLYNKSAATAPHNAARLLTPLYFCKQTTQNSEHEKSRNICNHMAGMLQACIHIMHMH